MARCDSPQEARLRASAWVGRGAAGYVAEMDGGWAVLGAVYDTEKEATRIVKRMQGDEDIPAEAVRLEAEGLTLRVTAPEAQIEAIAGADALLRRQAGQLGEIALQLDRGEIGAESAKALCALAASEAAEASRSLGAISGAGENELCAGLIERLDTLSQLQAAVGDSAQGTATLSGMLRCAQLEAFMGQWRMQADLRA